MGEQVIPVKSEELQLVSLNQVVPPAPQPEEKLMSQYSRLYELLSWPEWMDRDVQVALAAAEL